MTIARFLLAYLAYRLGDWLEAIDCPTFAAWLDWLLGQKKPDG